MTARLTQLITRIVTYILFGLSGWIAGAPIEGDQATELNNIGTAISVAIVGGLVFLVDLVMHRLQTGWWFKNPEIKP